MAGGASSGQVNDVVPFLRAILQPREDLQLAERITVRVCTRGRKGRRLGEGQDGRQGRRKGEDGRERNENESRNLR